MSIDKQNILATIKELILIHNTFTCTDKLHTELIIRFKQDGNAVNIVNTTEINFPPHHLVRRT